jgi:drug/metabolite transporter (DMT)-like permease
MPNRRYATGLPLWLAMATIYLVWGSTYLGIAIAIESLPPFLMAAIRFAIAGGLLLAWEAIRTRGHLTRPTLREARDSAIVGTLLLGIGNGFVAFGEQTVASGIAAIIVAMIPLWLVVFGWVYFRDHVPPLAAIGVAVGLVGVAVLVWPFGGAASFDALGIAILVLAPIGWAHGTLFSAHRARLPHSPFVASGLQMVAGAGVLAVEGTLTGELGRLHLDEISGSSLLALGYLIAFGSMLAFTTYAWLLRHAPLSLVGTYAYVNPIVAVALGAVFLAEPISPRTLLAGVVIVTAVAMIVTARSRAARPAEELAAPEFAPLSQASPPTGAAAAVPASAPVAAPTALPSSAAGTSRAAGGPSPAAGGLSSAASRRGPSD